MSNVLKGSQNVVISNSLPGNSQFINDNVRKQLKKTGPIKPIKYNNRNASDIDLFLAIAETAERGVKYDKETIEVANKVVEFKQRGESDYEINQWLLKCYKQGE